MTIQAISHYRDGIKNSYHFKDSLYFITLGGLLTSPALS